ncbi:hypothetical protein M758_7G053100 [Ceratodon purpureus]|nr:hypothetical protein M758_7G053100 [Ceratodon purpureus]
MLPNSNHSPQQDQPAQTKQNKKKHCQNLHTDTNTSSKPTPCNCSSFLPHIPHEKKKKKKKANLQTHSTFNKLNSNTTKAPPFPPPTLTTHTQHPPPDIHIANLQPSTKQSTYFTNHQSNIFLTKP